MYVPSPLYQMSTTFLVDFKKLGREERKMPPSKSSLEWSLTSEFPKIFLYTKDYLKAKR